MLKSCTWEIHQSRRGTSLLRAAVGDYRTKARPNAPGAVSSANASCTGTKESAAGGDYCLSGYRHGIKVVRNNLRVTVMWADTGVSRIGPEGARAKVEKQVSKQLAEQVLARLPG
ncbi:MULTISPECIES: hypothetical protein [Actinomadura]|uniref:Uncharacterized protein n=1 Tax=Actinomadura yumaensis TaxID=111807 RepID=A0ABW2C9G9_9ACTN|nr:hypothetical protein [Actinomadura sp. J1-007]MWK33965.1 hypothetical protein [Actinomadura sp. J1-007]